MRYFANGWDENKESQELLVKETKPRTKAKK